MISPAEWYEVSWYDIVVVRSLWNSLSRLRFINLKSENISCRSPIFADNIEMPLTIQSSEISQLTNTGCKQ